MKVAVGLSGGVDSSVVSALLKEQGHDVIGLYMKIWEGEPTLERMKHACYGPTEAMDIESARHVAETLGIPFYIFELGKEYNNIVLDYFKSEYLSGRTPNPCLRCNHKMKFGILLEKALGFGVEFDYFATGHYARIGYDSERNRHLLKKAKDLTKDQSYGLVFLSQEQLSRTLMPLGEITKTQVRKIAKDIGLKTYDIPDSQDFFSGDYTELLDATPLPGQILDKGGNILGTHKGIWHYTIGQRKGLKLSTVKPVYVKEIDVENNVIIVGPKDEIFSDELIATDLNPIAIGDFSEAIEASVKIRHSREETEGIITPIDDNRVHVKFKEPQWAISPGQVVAFYDDDIVLGGGIITASTSN